MSEGCRADTELSYDIDSASQILEEHDFLGTFSCELAEIVSADSTGFTGPLT